MVESGHIMGPEILITSSNTTVDTADHDDVNHHKTGSSNVVEQTNACNDASPKIVVTSNTLGQTTEHDVENSVERFTEITGY